MLDFQLADSKNPELQEGIDALEEGFAVFSAQDQLLICNRSFRQRYKRLDGLLQHGLTWRIFVYEAQRQLGIQLSELDAHLQTEINEPFTIESERNGKHWVRSTIRPTTSGGFVLTESDIHSPTVDSPYRSTTIEELKEILDGCASRIALIDADVGQILYHTPAWRRTFGQLPQIADAFTSKLAYADLLTDMLPTGQFDDIELSMNDASQQPFPARISGRLIDFQSSTAIVISAEDLTQLHQQRDEIVLINQRMHDAIGSLDQGFALFNKHHRLISCNKKYLDNTAIVIGKVELGMDNQKLVDAARRRGKNPAMLGWPDPTTTEPSEDYEFSKEDGTIYSANRRATSDGGFVLSWRDITKTRKTENELKLQRETSLQNEKLTALGQLLAGVAHELNNPLSVVVGHAMMLRDEVSDKSAIDSIDSISRSAERCVKIVKTFLAMARQKPAQLSQIDINSVVELANDVVTYSMKRSGIDVRCTLDHSMPDVYADEDQLAQVLVNLMINAEHALTGHSENPEVHVSTNYDETTEQVRLLVSDNGPGITPELKKRIFEPFFTTKQVGHGTGVGLSLCHRIAQTHNGSLTLTTSELGGASFLLSLPPYDQFQSEQELGSSNRRRVD